MIFWDASYAKVEHIVSWNFMFVDVISEVSICFLTSGSNIFVVYDFFQKKV
jgi:hypothetical protein